MRADLTPARLDPVVDPDVIARVVAVLTAHRRPASGPPKIAREAA